MKYSNYFNCYMAVTSAASHASSVAKQSKSVDGALPLNLIKIPSHLSI